MSKKSAGLLFIIIICLLGGAVLTYYSIQIRLKEIPIWVIKDGLTIQPNTKITRDLLHKVAKKTYYLPSDTILNDSMVGMYAKTTLYGGREILRREVDANPTVDTKLGYNLNTGERIVSITVDNSDSAGGILAKGQFIDLQWVYQVDQKKKVLVPLFNHIEVLDVRTKYGASVNTVVNKPKEEQKIKIVGDSGATDLKDLYPLEAVLRVSETQEDMINLAKKSGIVTVGINPQKEDNSQPQTSISTDDLLSKGGVSFESSNRLNGNR